MDEYRNNETVDLKGLFICYLSHWRLILGCGIASFVIALLYILLYPKTYEAAAQVIFQDDKDAFSSQSTGLGSAAGLMSSFRLGGTSASSVVFDDELVTLTSNQLVREVVKELGLYVDYMEPYTFGYRMYGEEPLKISCDSLTLATMERTIKMEIEHKANGHVHIDTDVKYSTFNHHKQSFSLEAIPAEINVEGCKIQIDYAIGKESVRNTRFKLLANVNPPTGVAEGLISDFKMEDYSNASNVLQMSYCDYEPQRAKDIFASLISCYNKQAEDYKQRLASNSLKFLTERLNYTFDQLSKIEVEIELHMKNSDVTRDSYDMPLYTELQSKIIELDESRYLVDLMDKFVRDSTNRYKLIPMLYTPSVTDISDSDGTPLSAYNDILLQRERIIKNSSEYNPMVAALSAQADQMRENVFLMIEKTKMSLERTYNELKNKESQLLLKMGEVPNRKRVSEDLYRQREIYQGVYLVLLQKREDIILAINQGKERGRMIDPPYIKSALVAPRKLYAAIGVIFFTLFVSIGWLCSKWFVLSIWGDLQKELAKK